ncbi:MAG TPA: lipid II flippase MurJ, partial [Nitrospinota bacterium]|nr:lipid II flippase MurJ [Nitrospinota bacterium]
VRVLRFLIFTILSHTLSGVLVISLNALNVFVLPAALSLLPTLGVVLCVGILAPSLGLDAWILGNLAGPAAFLLALGVVLWRQGYRYRPVLDFRQPELRETLRRVSQFFISSAFTQGQVLSTRLVASLLAPGSLSALFYAERLFLAASALFTIPLPNVVFPELVRMKVGDRLDDLKALVFKTSRALVLILLPIGIGMMAVSGLVVWALLQRGAFEAEDAFRTSWALVLYFIAFVPLGYKMLFTNTHHALGKTRVVVIGLCAAQGTIIAGNFLFTRMFDYIGVPVAHVLGQFVLVAVHVHFLRASFSSLKGIFWNPSNRRSLTAAVLMGAAAVLSQWLWPAGPETSGLWRGGVLIGVIGGSALVYAGLVLGFGVPEVKDLAAQVRARFKRGAL